MVHAEYHEMKLFHQYLEIRNIPHFHVPNEYAGNQKRGSQNKAMGVSSGVPDMFIYLPNNINAVVEMKEPSGKNKATPAQMRWLKILASRGYKVAICYGVHEAISFLKELGYRESDNQLEF